MDPEDETAAALAALRGLDAERAADEDAERAATPGSASEQAVLALTILGERRPWHVEDRRTLGLARAADDEGWPDAVERRLRELDDAAVIDGWLALADRDASPRRPTLRTLVATALARTTDLAPFLHRLDALLRRPSPAATDVMIEAATCGAAGLAPDVIELLHGILRDPEVRREVAEHAVLIAGAGARCSRRAAALIAERARADRARRLGEAEANLPIERCTTVSSSTLAEAVRTSGCALLTATALLELERAADRAPWARALLAIAPDAGAQYLARMRGRPGWSALAGAPPERPGDPLTGLTSPLADVRRAALEALSRAPRPEHLQAFLLGAELDRFVTDRMYRTPWRRLTPTPWLPLLIAHATGATTLDSVLANPPRRRTLLLEQLAVLRADQLLDQLLDGHAARAAMPVAQELSPALRELAEHGVEACANQIAVPPLPAEDRAALELEEAELAGS